MLRPGRAIPLWALEGVYGPAVLPVIERWIASGRVTRSGRSVWLWAPHLDELEQLRQAGGLGSGTDSRGEPPVSAASGPSSLAEEDGRDGAEPASRRPTLPEHAAEPQADREPTHLREDCD